MKYSNTFSSREHFPSFIMIILGLSLFLVQCNDRIMNSTKSVSDLPASRPLMANNYINTEPIHDIQVPDQWNGDLIVYAHGYVDPQKDLALPDDKINDIPVASIVTGMGVAYATTSYTHNGLNGPEAVNDLINLVNEFKDKYENDLKHVYLVGVSEGALITTLAVEQHPKDFSGGLAVCGPVGNFSKQLDYFGDFHVLFHYFFPGIDVGTPAGVDEEIIDAWLNGDLKETITTALSNNPGKTLTLLKVANVPVKDGEIINTVLGLLRYNILATNDAIDRLGGLPYDNSHRYYRGIGSFRQDILLNRNIPRYSADAKALKTIKKEFETSGNLSHPLVTMHNTKDPIVPYWHEPIYTLKVLKERASLLHNNIPIFGRYGHCNLTLDQFKAGFALLQYKVNKQDLLVLTN